jgi:hypothetical protein
VPRPMPQPKSVYACFLPRDFCGAHDGAAPITDISRTNTEKPAETPLPL